MFVAIISGGCSSVSDYTSSIGDREALRIGRAIMPEGERKRLLREMNRVKHDHFAIAVYEIESR